MSWRVEVTSELVELPKEFSFQDRPVISEGTHFVRVAGEEFELWVRQGDVQMVKVTPINPLQEVP